MLLGQNSGGGGVDRLGHQRGLAMYADWTDRIMAGELPQRRHGLRGSNAMSS